MAAHFTIELKGLKFYAPHGMYAEEAKVGNAFEVDVILHTGSPDTKIDALDQTVNYVEVYTILAEAFAIRRQLLESLAMDIAESLHQRFPQIQKLSISIKKNHPPITNFSGAVGITYTKDFK